MDTGIITKKANHTVLVKSETSLTGYHWQLEEVEAQVYWVAEYLNGEFNSASEATGNLKKAYKTYKVKAGKLKELFNDASQIIENNTVVRHKFFKMGAAGEFTLLGIWSVPPRSTLEHNPDGYYRQIRARPKCCQFHCDHCGMAIDHHYVIRDEKGEHFSVGSSCVEKIGQTSLITEAKAAKLEVDRKKRQVIREKKQQERREAFEVEMEAQRKKNNGLTDDELKSKEREDAREAYIDLCLDETQEIVRLLKEQGGDFCKGMAREMRSGYIPRNNGKAIVIEIMTKKMSGARKNSKAYKEAYPKAEEMFNLVEAKLAAAKPKFF